jgi:hypothetical protein
VISEIPTGDATVLQKMITIDSIILGVRCATVKPAGII